MSLLKCRVLASLLTSRVSSLSPWARQNFPAPLIRTNSLTETTQQHMPRLCRIKKKEGYGFSFYEDGQDGRKKLCQIQGGSPAEEAGLLEEDVLIEVNDVNVEEEEAACVLQIIKDSQEVKLLVVDTVADKFYKDQGVKVTSKMPGVKHMASKLYFSVANFYADSDSKPDIDPQQIRPYRAGYDKAPANGSQQLKSNHLGSDPPTYGQLFGDSAGPYPTIQQPQSPAGNQPVFPRRKDSAAGLTICAICVCFCFCWCLGAMGIYYASKSAEYYRQGNFEKGKKYRHIAVCFIVVTIVVGIIFGLASVIIKSKNRY